MSPWRMWYLGAEPWDEKVAGKDAAAKLLTLVFQQKTS